MTEVAFCPYDLHRTLKASKSICKIQASNAQLHAKGRQGVFSELDAGLDGTSLEVPQIPSH